MAATALHPVIMVFWKKTAFRLWRTVDLWSYYGIRYTLYIPAYDAHNALHARYIKHSKTVRIWI